MPLLKQMKLLVKWINPFSTFRRPRTPQQHDGIADGPTLLAETDEDGDEFHLAVKSNLISGAASDHSVFIHYSLFRKLKLNHIGIAYHEYEEIINWSKFLEDEIKRFKLRTDHPDQKIFSAGENDFDYFKIIGAGGFATVVLVRQKADNLYLAMKIVHKVKISNQEKLQRCLIEKNILLGIYFPFVLSLIFYFQDKVNLYFVLPFIMGGDLFEHLRHSNRFTQKYVQFYSAQIVLALEYLHNLHIIYRDLKPENILLDHMGYLKLSDFGLSKIVQSRTYSFIGTVEYLAPEVLDNKGYGISIDWWALGILIYELSTGMSPFASGTVMKTMQNIVECKYLLPLWLSYELRDLLVNLLVCDLSKRYGNLKNGVDDIKNHQFYSGIDWLQLLNRTVDPPYRPYITSPDDTRYFNVTEFKKEKFNMNKGKNNAYI